METRDYWLTYCSEQECFRECKTRESEREREESSWMLVRPICRRWQWFRMAWEALTATSDGNDGTVSQKNPLSERSVPSVVQGVRDQINSPENTIWPIASSHFQISFGGFVKHKQPVPPKAPPYCFFNPFYNSNCILVFNMIKIQTGIGR